MVKPNQLKTKLHSELRSLNSKGLELNARLPMHLREIEVQLKKCGGVPQRGKIDLSLNIENISESNVKTINVAVNQYIEQLKGIEDLDRSELLGLPLNCPIPQNGDQRF